MSESISLTWIVYQKLGLYYEKFSIVFGAFKVGYIYPGVTNLIFNEFSLMLNFAENFSFPEVIYAK